MSDWTPGEGWRKRKGEVLTDSDPLIIYSDGEGNTHQWVREEPVPPLPTEPYTVIQVSWDLQANLTHRVFLFVDGLWRNKHGDVLDTDDIAGFEVLAEPVVMVEEPGSILAQVRRETAKAVADFVRLTSFSFLATAIEQEFGVQDDE